VTRDGGILVGKHTYYPFGAEMDLTPHEGAVELMKFTGHERDIVAGDNASVDYMHARSYNGNLGRFLSVDSHLGKSASPQSWNRNSYAVNNPVRAIDPDGRETIVVTTFDYTIGTHSAVAIARGSEHLLYDPAGSYVPPSSDNGRRSVTDTFEGDDAKLQPYLNYQQSTGSQTKIEIFETTTQEEQQIKDRIAAQPDTVPPGHCAAEVSSVLDGIGPFQKLGSYILPGRLYDKLKELLGEPTVKPVPATDTCSGGSEEGCKH
jgi:RHS repeat-associated protein